ncbi:hypothetical protein MASSI9I_50598 [Massilia sp. 9I]|nr:hypothetical protein MASSI9I_50598 [Massilia sp. 9I]
MAHVHAFCRFGITAEIDDSVKHSPLLQTNSSTPIMRSCPAAPVCRMRFLVPRINRNCIQITFNHFHSPQYSTTPIISLPAAENFREELIFHFEIFSKINGSRYLTSLLLCLLKKFAKNQTNARGLKLNAEMATACYW